jgi:hypothetical protein
LTHLVGLEFSLERVGEIVCLLVDFLGEIQSGLSLAGRGTSSLLELDLVGEGWSVVAA